MVLMLLFALHAGADIRHGLFGAGIESSHALERTHEDSILESEKLLRAYCLSEIKTNQNFRVDI